MTNYRRLTERLADVEKAHAQAIWQWAKYEGRAKVLRTALQSIAANTCCGPCQEAAKVARAAIAAERTA